MSGQSDSGLSRRTFLAGMASLPIAARLKGSVTSGGSSRRICVVGAGAFGGWTALNLRLSGAEVVLVDAWGAGNSRSSSGGESRVIRAVYGTDRIYVEMVKRAYEMWEQLDVSCDEPLYVETGALWMHRGSDAYVRSSLSILDDLEFPVEHLTVEDAALRYPKISFDGIKTVYLERRAGVLSARRACAAVRDAFLEAGGQYRRGQATPGEIVSGSLSSIRLDDGSRIEADTFVFSCGPWLGELFPDVLGDVIRPTRQEVYYFGTPPGSKYYTPDKLPVWIDFGERILYGIPDVHGRGFKVADDTRGEPIDPTTGDRAPGTEGILRARGLLAERFPELKDAPLLEARVCQYENSPDGHLIIDQHPGASNVWLAGGGSGHGFKLSPAVGEITARAIVADGDVPAMFRLARLQDAKLGTQFERKNDG